MSAVELSPEQKVVIQSWGKGLAILAGAGSGKTTTLVLKCAALMKRKSDARFCAVSFTERSASDLKVKLTKEGVLSAESSGHWVMTIHGLCAAVIGEYPREAGFDGEESMLSQSESVLIWERALESIWAEELQPEIQRSLELLLDREGRDGTYALLRRVRDLETFGALKKMEGVSDVATQALLTVATFVLDRYDRLKRRRGVLDFNDLERGADRALSYPEVSNAFRSRFDLVLVDEFQDTNPVQASIITRMVLADFSNLCVVGDPKQSIYRFRDADVAVFEDFCSRLPERHSLTWNFRSRPGIIHYANTVCEELFLHSNMPYEALIPKRESVEESSVERLDVKDPNELAVFLKGLWKSGVPLHEMALLLRRIRGNEKWLQALSANGIPIAVGSGGFFWEDPRVRELVSFLKWWHQSGHSFSGAVFLRAPWVGVSDLEIDAWIKTDLLDEFLKSSNPLARVLAPLRNSVLSPGEILLKLLISDPVEEELGSAFLGLWHRVEEMSSRGLDFHQVVTELSNAIQEKRRERDVPPPQNQGQIAVLTLHSAKGLEFPRVILLDFAGERRASPAPLLFWDKYEGVYLAGRDSDGSRVDQDPVEQHWRKTEREKDLAESKRLFYVALTRAQEKLLLVFSETKPMTKTLQAELEKDPQALLKRDHWRGWAEQTPIEPAFCPAEIQNPHVEKSFSEIMPISRLAHVRVPVFRPRHSVTEWSVLTRCPRAYEWKYIRPAPLRENGDKPQAFSQELSQRELGTRVHAALETGDANSLRALEEMAGSHRLSAERVLGWLKSSELMSASDSVWSELAFEVPIGREVLVGSIDRLVKRGDHWQLIDFKVTEKQKSEFELVEAYLTQLELYSYAIGRLEPGALAIDAYLVNLSPGKITEIRVPLHGIDPEVLAQQAGRIVEGEAGRPRPSAHCRVCDFKRVCDAAEI